MKKTSILFGLLFPTFFLLGQNPKLINLKELSPDFIYEIHYATPNNFMEEELYECAECFLRPEVAHALNQANEYFLSLGYQIKIFDCYRPLSVQKKMWNRFPNPSYVANPHRSGSIHNRGAAVDLTLVGTDGKTIDMGTGFDSFKKEAHTDNYNLPESVLENRKILFEGMKKFGFSPIRTEWWHFSYYKNYSYEVLDISVCD